MSTPTNFSSDKPIINEEDDQFQRYNFSKRIAQTIINRNTSDCVVIGIYGLWGEGKTSVVNFIESELNKNDSVSSIKFNPWRYNDEKTLLIQFFQSLANGIDTKLKTKTEDVGKLLKKYGGLLSFNVPYVGNPGEKLKKVGELLDGADVETLRTRIEKALIESNQKIVVFIDDIDRLDKQEIHSIFRLVKLNADFSNIIYVLSFDEKMVSCAIGERFGDGSSSSGQSFLEKIIQIPLKIPVAQPEALNKFCYKFINESFLENNLQLTEKELKRFGNQFYSNILIRLKTPRLAVRYGNTLSFAIPLLKGEANIIDLLLLEAIKTFYPTFYEFIKTNPQFFIGGYSARFAANKDEDKKATFKKHFDDLSLNFSHNEKDSIKELIIELFPILKEVYFNYGYTHSVSWEKDKRVCSSKYFNRYFTYSVIKGELSDIEFEEFISSVLSSQIPAITEKMKLLIEGSSPDAFVNKLRVWENDFEWEVSSKLAKVIVVNSELFPENKHLFQMSFESPNGIATIFISQILKKHINKIETLRLAKELIKTATHISFAFSLYYQIAPDSSEVESLFSKDGFKSINKILMNRALKEANGVPLFEKFSDEALSMFSAWKDADEESLIKYFNELLSQQPKKVEQLILAYTPIVHSSGHPKPYKTNFDEERFKYFTSIIDKDVIYQAVIKVYSPEELESEAVKWSERMGENPDKINIIRQYLHWYGKAA